MQTTKVVEFARQLLEAHGDQAEVQAARKVQEAEARGDREEAGNWRRVRSAIHELRPPHMS